MARKLDYDEINALSDNAPSSPILEVVDAARRAYCNLYISNPTWTVAKDNIILPVVTRTLDNFCSDIGSPPPPPPPNFSGGQCPGIEYIVTVEADRGFGGTTTPVTYTLTGYGEIRSIQAEFNPPEFPNVLTVMVRGEPGAKVPGGSDGEIVGGAGFTITITSISVVRFDGQPDTCGDPPGEGYPPIPPPTLPDVTQTINITNNAGDSIDYGTVVNFDVDGTILFPPTVNVEGIEVTIDVGGVSIDNSKSKKSGGGGGQSVPLDEEEEEEEETEEIEKLVAITISSVGESLVHPSTSGRGTSPDVFYIGWVQFSFEGFNYPRQFIHHEQARFQAPDEVDDYTIRFNDGWEGAIEEIIETVEVPVVEESETSDNGGEITINPL